MTTPEEVISEPIYGSLRNIVDAVGTKIREQSDNYIPDLNPFGP